MLFIGFGTGYWLKRCFFLLKMFFCIETCIFDYVFDEKYQRLKVGFKVCVQVSLQVSLKVFELSVQTCNASFKVSMQTFSLIYCF